jgi:hypothetical protein
MSGIETPLMLRVSYLDSNAPFNGVRETNRKPSDNPSETYTVITRNTWSGEGVVRWSPDSTGLLDDACQAKPRLCTQISVIETEMEYFARNSEFRAKQGMAAARSQRLQPVTRICP